MKEIEKTGKTINEAIEVALKDLGVTRDMVNIEVLEEPNKGLFGFLGNKLAKVKVQLIEEKSIYKSNVDEKIEVPTVKRDINEKHEFVVNEETIEQAKTLLQDIFKAMKIDVNMEVLKKEDHIHINLVGSDLGILIGRRGDTLDALQYLLNLSVNRKKENRIRFILDVESYRERREKTLQNLALRLADKAIKKGNDVVLEPMNPHERRIIHTTLQEVDGVTTRSEGEEPYRKIVITPKG